jgi:hypothetical protein
MSEPAKPQPEKLALGDSHRRIVSALLRGIEEMRAEIERWIDPEPGVLVSIKDRLSGSESERLRAQLARLEEELRRMRREIELDVASRPAARSIEALLVEHLSLLQETAGGELRGYGEMDPGTRTRLEAEFARLQEIFEAMLRVVRRASPNKS